MDERIKIYELVTKTDRIQLPDGIISINVEWTTTPEGVPTVVRTICMEPVMFLSLFNKYAKKTEDKGNIVKFVEIGGTTIMAKEER